MKLVVKAVTDDGKVESEHVIELPDGMGGSSHRPKLTSITPDLSNNAIVQLAACAECGTVQVFRRNTFPTAGYWTECRACREWTDFFMLSLVATVTNTNKGYSVK